MKSQMRGGWACEHVYVPVFVPSEENVTFEG